MTQVELVGWVAPGLDAGSTHQPRGIPVMLKTLWSAAGIPATRGCPDGSPKQQQQQTGCTDNETIIRERIQRPGIVLAEITHQKRRAGKGGDARSHRGQ